MEISFHGKRALVTGAGRGIGRDLVKRLVKYGANVIAISRTESTLESLKEECPGIEIIAVDVGDWNAAQSAVEKIGPVDLLVNNAGIMRGAAFGDMTEELCDSMINTNLKGIVVISQIVVKGMIERGTGGSIVNVSSVGAKFSVPGLSMYQATKGGLDQLTRNMAAELGPHNIRVNTVNPTGVETDLIKGFEHLVDEMITKIPIRRICQTSDVVDTIVYLLSDKAAMVHGANVYVDGGNATGCS